MSGAYNERELIELPLLEQLAGLGWQRLPGDTSVPQNTERVGAGYEYYLEWKTTSPVPEKVVAASLGVETLAAHQRLAAGMLRPENLLLIVRDFVLFADWNCISFVDG